MKEDVTLQGERLILRPVTVEDVKEEYVSWLNDPETNKYLESRFVQHTKESVGEYVKSMTENSDIVFLAITKKDGGQHIGNIKLGPIDRNHKHADIGILIGDKDSWGQGFATEAVALLVEYAFSTLNLHKVWAGAYGSNLGSIKALLKVGFVEEGRQKNHYYSEGGYEDRVLLALWDTNK